MEGRKAVVGAVAAFLDRAWKKRNDTMYNEPAAALHGHTTEHTCLHRAAQGEDGKPIRGSPTSSAWPHTASGSQRGCVARWPSCDPSAETGPDGGMAAVASNQSAYFTGREADGSSPVAS